jgi:hypothetical protein
MRILMNVVKSGARVLAKANLRNENGDHEESWTCGGIFSQVLLVTRPRLTTKAVSQP